MHIVVLYESQLKQEIACYAGFYMCTNEQAYVHHAPLLASMI